MIPEIPWLVAAGMICLVWGLLCWNCGPRTALGAVVPLSLMIPVWILQPFLGEKVGVPIIVSVVALLGYTFHRERRLLSPLTGIDIFVGLLFAVHICSDVRIEGVTAMVPLRAYGEWVLPYVAGRYAVRDEDCLRGISLAVVLVVIVLGVPGVVESVTGTNLFEVLCGQRPLEGFDRNASRFGFKRAYGCTLHPIFFGILQLTLLPWCIPYLGRTVSSGWRVFGWVAFLIGVLGVLSSVSRGPALALVLGVLFFCCVLYRRLRMPVMTLCLLGLVGVILFPERLVRKAEKMVNEDRGRLIQIDGEMTSMTGGLTRLLIFQVYGRAAAYAGLLGYGTTATNDFPPDVPYIYVPKETLKRVHSIENAYLLITLRFGFLGLAFFTGILLTGIGTALMSPLQTSSAPLMQGIASVLAVVALVLLSVWFSYICAFAVLWTVGVVSGIRSHQKFMVQNPEQEPGSVTAWSH
jgi:hypothetical protein